MNQPFQVEFIPQGSENGALRLPSGAVIEGAYNGGESDTFTKEEARHIETAVNAYHPDQAKIAALAAALEKLVDRDVSYFNGSVILSATNMSVIESARAALALAKA